MPATKPDIAGLIARMPDVDLPKPPEPKKKKEGEAQDEQPAKPQPPPDPNRPGKFTGPDPEVAENIFAEIVAGGRDAFQELLDLVQAPGDAEFKNYKAGYVLHGLAIYLGAEKHQMPRQILGKALASALDEGKRSKPAKALLIQELQTIAGKDAAPALGKQLSDDELNEPATRALVSIREGVVKEFLNALPAAKGRSRLNIIQALGLLGDRTAIAPLKKLLQTAEESDARMAAAWAVANQSDSSSTQTLLDLAEKAEGWERTQLTNSCLLLAEKLVAEGRKQDAARIYAHLRDTRKDDAEGYVREAATRGLKLVPTS